MQIDPRGPRFAAAITSAVLAVALITGSGPLLAGQALVYALGAFGGPQHSPYGWLFRLLVLPRLAPPSRTADERPLRFAQGVGLVFTAIGALGFFTGVPWLGLLTASFALAAAFLGAAFGYCLGCEIYPLVRHTRSRLGNGA
ncbi:DUF4395 domain-containing protein [Streptomyces rubellomurinus]|uniref:Membrane protein n=2 Tax=Streptomyces TaxID=1883 RepID=A0A0F2T686_STRR3|nr:DUF4395 domain-containing protein [Streptomyces rubellomurinus]KJS52459.1 membrane protein [Streptomyces rubellomurinus subsp. indigoferus]KJS57850.1 membrane protein [Streptomyces rubellomurinus]